MRFTGRELTGLFDTSTVTVPPQLWVTVDGGPQSLVTVDRPEIELAPPGLRPGVHTVRVDVKDTDQVTNRWLPPLDDAVIVRGLRLAARRAAAATAAARAGDDGVLRRLDHRGHPRPR